jgi:hypothetical protein
MFFSPARTVLSKTHLKAMPEMLRRPGCGFLILLFFLLEQPALHAARPLNREAALEEMMNQTMMALYAFKFDQADSISGEMKDLAPGHYMVYFTRANYLWWLIATHPPDEGLENSYASTIRQAQEAIPQNTASGHNPDELFYAINIFAIQARMSLRNKEYIATLRNLRAGLGYVGASRGQEPRHHGLYLTSGLYRYMFGYVQQRYPLLKLVTRAFPDGDVEQGIQYLLLAAQSDNPVWKTEAHYLLMKIFLEMEHKPQSALDYSNWLMEQYPGNLVFLQYRYRIFKALDDPTAMRATQEHIRQLAKTQSCLSPAQRSFFLGE